MRVTSQSIFQQGLGAMQDLQRRLSHTQLQIATGRRVLTPADDPIAATRALGLDAAMARNDQYQRNANLAGNRLSLTEQVLQDVGNVLYRTRDLVIQASNDSQTAETRGLIATEIRELHGALVQLGNTRDGEDHYLFAGYSNQTRPFVEQAGAVQYQGDDGQRLLRISESRDIADGESGRAVFLAGSDGNGRFVSTADPANNGTGVLGAGSVVDPALWDGGDYRIEFLGSDSYQVVDGGGAVIASGNHADGEDIAFAGISVQISGAPAAGDSFDVSASGRQDMFRTLADLAATLDSAVETPLGLAKMHNALNGVLNNIDQGVGHLLNVRTKVGTKLQAVDSQQSANADYGLILAESAASLQELDYSEALTRLNLELTQLEAAQQSFARMQNLSLFRMLG